MGILKTKTEGSTVFGNSVKVCLKDYNYFLQKLTFILNFDDFSKKYQVSLKIFFHH